MEDFVCGIEALQTGEELHFRNLPLTFHVGYLASITEKFSNQLTVTVLDGETALASEKINITVMAFDEFPGFQHTPELLTSFAMPNHPAVVSLIQLVSKYLEKWTGDPSLTVISPGDQERVKTWRQQLMRGDPAEKILHPTVIKKNPPGGMHRQRALEAAGESRGIDLTLLYAACPSRWISKLRSWWLLEGQAFLAGVWLVDGARLQIFWWMIRTA